MATFGVLGPVAVDTGRGPVRLAGAKQRAVLAVLALHANQVVGTEALTEVLWPDGKPADARQAVLNHVARLRRTLGAAADHVQTGTGGYRLVVRDPAELDCRHAAALADAAVEAIERGDWYEGQHLALTALGLWRGEPLADVANDRLRCEWLGVFDALRLRLEETQADALLAGGRYERAAACLAAPITTWPLHEPLYERRLVAFYGAGRRADALSVYRTLRSALREGLGVDPAERMRALQALVLRDAPLEEVVRAWRHATAGPASTAAATSTPASVAAPAQLPRRPHLLVGRSGELADLTRILVGSDRLHADTGSHIAILTGPAGVGKTSLALAWAHGVADRFPDGRFYLDLNGFAADAPPTCGDDAVTILLDFLGVPSRDQPSTPEGRLARYRAATAGKQLLIVFDNACDAAQARPLLPAGDACRALVTSRRSLAGLVALDGADQIAVAPLAAEDSRRLLSRRLGPHRVTGQEAAIEAIAEHCAHLPLALSVAAARAASMPATPLAALAGQLRAGALDALCADEAAGNVRNVLSWSYLALPAEAARVFRYLGLHPGPELTPAAAAALAEIPPGRAHAVLGDLATVNLLAERGPGRYTMHSLLRAFAVEQFAVEEFEVEQSSIEAFAVQRFAAEQFAAGAAPDLRHRALHRLYDYHLRWAIAADRSLATGSATLPAAVEADGVQLPTGLEPAAFTDREAMAWFATERTVLMSLAAHAQAVGLVDYACRLAAAQSNALIAEKRYHDAAKQGRVALAAAKRLADLGRQGNAYFQIGRALAHSGESDTARFQLERALRIQRSLDDLTGLAETHRALVVAHRDLGSMDKAHQHAVAHLAAARRLGHRPSIRDALAALDEPDLLSAS